MVEIFDAPTVEESYDKLVKFIKILEHIAQCKIRTFQITIDGTNHCIYIDEKVFSETKT